MNSYRLSNRQIIYLTVWSFLILTLSAAASKDPEISFGMTLFMSIIGTLSFTIIVEPTIFLLRIKKKRDLKRNATKLESQPQIQSIHDERIHQLVQSGHLPGVYTEKQQLDGVKEESPKTALMSTGNKSLSSDDDDDDVASDQISHEIDALTFTMKYCDVKGDVTRRTISTSEISRDYIKGFCHLRKAPRTFRIDRIESITTEDGEVLNVDEFIRRTGIMQAISASQNERARVIQNQLRPALGVLVAVAKADGIFRDSELQEISNYCKSAMFNYNISLTGEELSEVSQRVQRMRPSVDNISYYVQNIRSWPASERKLFIDFVQKVILSDGEMKVEEAMVFGEIKGLLYI